ncbi:MAG: nickel pincer cofactor biosynthesis protein LarC [Acidimicrobiia bacterium]|nr:nickel pincer cofactor biosynthesis protein LarC [Acidimicrobiia bacterium]
MSRVIYFDCFSGVSGDMLLGACLDAGLPLAALKAALGSLALEAQTGYAVSATRVLRCGVSATKFDVVEHLEHHEHHHRDHAPRHEPDHPHDRGQTHHHAHAHGHSHEQGTPAGHHHPHRSLPEIVGVIERSALSAAGRLRAKALFQRLAEAEAAIHDMPVERVHLHEVGALDSIIDIVGAVFAMEWWNADRIVCSPLNVGSGMVRSAHGVFPVPAPATVRLLGDAPVYAGQVQKELVTPTGALLVTEYATSFGPIPAMRVDHVGYGAGARDHPETPNVMRLMVGREVGSSDAASTLERVVVLECEIDDMNPQIFGVVMDRLYAAGALDVFYVPVQMKKNRPGTLLTVVATADCRRALADIIFAETTTLGLRVSEMERERLERELVPVTTPLGVIRFKVARREGRVVNVSPEFEDCAKLAATHGRSVKDIQALAVRSYGERELGRER